jgi:hypothetical protein
MCEFSQIAYKMLRMIDFSTFCATTDRFAAERLGGIPVGNSVARRQNAGLGRFRAREGYLGVYVKKSKRRVPERLRNVIPAKECVKKSVRRLKSGPQRRPRESGDPSNRLFQLEKWIPTFERVKKSVRRLKSGPQRHPRESGDPSKRLFHMEKWIPAFAGMTLRSLPEARNFDFFTRSFAGMTASTLLSLNMLQILS